jgi:hypothetical protein
MQTILVIWIYDEREKAVVCISNISLFNANLKNTILF